MIRSLSALMLLLGAFLSQTGQARADDGAGTDSGGFWVSEERHNNPSSSVSGQADHVTTEGTSISADAVEVPSCVGGAHAVTLAQLDLAYCMPAEPSEAKPAPITPAQVRRAFARLPLPASTLVIQPPDGLTLVNFDTNFYTTSTASITRRVRLLGRPVTIEATPSEYDWQFDDGDSLATDEPGAPYPDLTVTHNYLRKGTYAPRLDTVYSGRFRVGNGAWQQIPGTVTIAGAPQRLRAIEAQPKLVAPYGP